MAFDNPDNSSRSPAVDPEGDSRKAYSFMRTALKDVAREIVTNVRKTTEEYGPRFSTEEATGLYWEMQNELLYTLLLEGVARWTRANAEARK